MSDQYVSVPRELLERINTQLSEDWDRIDGEWGPSGYTLDQEVVRGEQPVIAELRALLDAPAEDVRAVGEESVGYAGLNGLKTLRGSDGYLIVSIKPERYLDIPLYRRPQRPVVLPDRLDESQYRGTSLLAARRWNACLDAVEALNKC